ncbi:transposase, partial [Mesorhizobium sp. M0220]|uniref:IS66-like element accessory protein TnpA n=1 Tax=Mesorhizobium sp. M0220 TaxID=2956920 RepID=UPI0033397219
IAETLEPNAVVSEVARRYGLRPQQVFAWRREARKKAASVQQNSPAFVPAVVAAAEPVASRSPKQQKRQATRDAGVIELEIDGVAMRVGRGADAKTVAAVIRALKATS